MMFALIRRHAAAAMRALTHDKSMLRAPYRLPPFARRAALQMRGAHIDMALRHAARISRCRYYALMYADAMILLLCHDTLRG